MPRPAELAAGREIAYSNLYKALEEYCGTLERPLNLCGLSLGG